MKKPYTKPAMVPLSTILKHRTVLRDEFFSKVDDEIAKAGGGLCLHKGSLAEKQLHGHTGRPAQI